MKNAHSVWLSSGLYSAVCAECTFVGRKGGGESLPALPEGGGGGAGGPDFPAAHQEFGS